jgi:hypothetical protein
MMMMHLLPLLFCLMHGVVFSFLDDDPTSPQARVDLRASFTANTMIAYYANDADADDGQRNGLWLVRSPRVNSFEVECLLDLGFFQAICFEQTRRR